MNRWWRCQYLKVENVSTLEILLEAENEAQVEPWWRDTKAGNELEKSYVDNNTLFLYTREFYERQCLR